MKNIPFTILNKELPFSNSMVLIGQAGSGKSTIGYNSYLPMLRDKYKYGIIIKFIEPNKKEIRKILNNNFFINLFFNRVSFIKTAGESFKEFKPNLIQKYIKRYFVLCIAPEHTKKIDNSFLDSLNTLFKNDYFVYVDEIGLIKNVNLNILKNKFILAQSIKQIEYLLGSDWKTHFSTIAQINSDFQKSEVSILSL